MPKMQGKFKCTRITKKGEHVNTKSLNYDDGITHVITTKTIIANAKQNMCQEKQLNLLDIFRQPLLFICCLLKNQNKEHQTYNTDIMFDYSMGSKLGMIKYSKSIFEALGNSFTIYIKRAATIFQKCYRNL